jgi:hypothetical protein
MPIECLNVLLAFFFVESTQKPGGMGIQKPKAMQGCRNKVHRKNWGNRCEQPMLNACACGSGGVSASAPLMRLKAFNGTALLCPQVFVPNNATQVQIFLSAQCKYFFEVPRTLATC